MAKKPAALTLVAKPPVAKTFVTKTFVAKTLIAKPGMARVAPPVVRLKTAPAPAALAAPVPKAASPSVQNAGAVSTVVDRFVKSVEAAGRDLGRTSNFPTGNFQTGNPKTSITQTISAMAGMFAGFQKTQVEAKTKMENAMKTGEQMVSFGQGNIEAVMKSSQIWAAGMQDLGKTFAAAAQAQLDHTMSTWKALTGVKSLKEAMDLQSNLARNSVGMFLWT